MIVLKREVITSSCEAQQRDSPQCSTVQSKCCETAQVKCVPTTTWHHNSAYLNDELQSNCSADARHHSISVMTQYFLLSIWSFEHIISCHNTAARCWVI